MTTKGLSQVLIDLCVEGMTWTVSRNDYYTIDHATLKPQCKSKGSYPDKEDKIPNKGVITKQIALRFLGEEMAKHPGFTSTTSPPMITDVTPSKSHIDFE
ncbi:hypothetical protein J1N35_011511 [Gossypium stocksii]|uniref:Uncharacterized protein n=1 Tax=Gossypium stocksii TaxID=47602 RepID=A0A9D4AD98_9ROSI|nr:hypothetical protein J1N35_011511 [Gossypium stocksii]